MTAPHFGTPQEIDKQADVDHLTSAARAALSLEGNMHPQQIKSSAALEIGALSDPAPPTAPIWATLAVARHILDTVTTSVGLPGSILGFALGPTWQSKLVFGLGGLALAGFGLYDGVKTGILGADETQATLCAKKDKPPV